MNNLTSYLFKTDAFKICEENKPFWYTSSEIGPYFINGHFLYGSEKDANVLLDFINEELENVSKEQIPQDIFSKVLFQYENNVLYSTIINNLITYIKENISIDDIDYISGGERRDWYFSNIVAYLLKKPHITIYKDLTCIKSTYNFSKNEPITKLDNANVLHVSDLLNLASSLLNSWIPAISNLGSKIIWSACAVDRCQGGSEKLEAASVKSLALINIDNACFEEALNLGIINKNQLEMLQQFVKKPYETMRNFLINHPELLENYFKSSDSKTAKRAKKCVEQNIYKL